MIGECMGSPSAVMCDCKSFPPQGDLSSLASCLKDTWCVGITPVLHPHLQGMRMRLKSISLSLSFERDRSLALLMAYFPPSGRKGPSWPDSSTSQAARYQLAPPLPFHANVEKPCRVISGKYCLYCINGFVGLKKGCAVIHVASTLNNTWHGVEDPDEWIQSKAKE